MFGGRTGCVDLAGALETTNAIDTAVASSTANTAANVARLRRNGARGDEDRGPSETEATALTESRIGPSEMSTLRRIRPPA